MITLEQIGETNRDCTSRYSVNLDKEYTVGELVNEILNNYPKNNWGDITLYIKNNVVPYTHDKIKYEYVDKKLKVPIHKENYLLKVTTATAYGGYSMMNYDIYL